MAFNLETIGNSFLKLVLENLNPFFFLFHTYPRDLSDVTCIPITPVIYSPCSLLGNLYHRSLNMLWSLLMKSLH